MYAEKSNESRIKVLIVEDTPSVAKTLKSCLALKKEIEIVGMTDDADVAFEIMNKSFPDVVLLDLVMPGSDGFCFLEMLSKVQANVPDVIILSAVGDQDIIRRALSYGVKYFMVKPIKEEVVSQRIFDVYCQKTNIHKVPAAEVAAKRTMDEKIASIFLAIGIPAHIRGYQFLREAIKMVVSSPDTINYITKMLYPGIAEHFGTSPSKVERAIRHAIEVAWTRGKIENMNSIFGYNIYSKLEKPTNGEFIALVADKLAMEKGA